MPWTQAPEFDVYDHQGQRFTYRLACHLFQIPYSVHPSQGAVFPRFSHVAIFLAY
jgi:hypothetical protein